MTERRILLDPTNEMAPARRDPLPRPDSLDGMTLGLLDISKARGNIFLDRLEERFAERGVTVRRFAKPTFTRPAPTQVRQDIAAQCDVVVEGLAD